MISTDERGPVHDRLEFVSLQHVARRYSSHESGLLFSSIASATARRGAFLTVATNFVACG